MKLLIKNGNVFLPDSNGGQKLDIMINNGVITEIAPGIDLQKDVLDKMLFKPLVSPELKTMDPRLFLEGKMNLK